jgi:hypothetical protein
MSSLAWLQSQEFVVGIVVGVILSSTFAAASLLRSIALALAAGGIIALYLQGGIPNLVAVSRMLVTEFRANSDFSNGMLIGIAIGAIVVLGFRRRLFS